MALRTSSIFTTTGNDDFAAQQEKVQLGLEPAPGDGALSVDSTDLQASAQANQRRRVVVCFEDGRVNPSQRKLREASRFTCPDTSADCQRTLFLDEGFILEINDPTATVLDSGL